MAWRSDQACQASSCPAALIMDMSSPRSSRWARRTEGNIAAGLVLTLLPVMVLHGGGGHSGAPGPSRMPRCAAGPRSWPRTCRSTAPPVNHIPRAVRYDDWIDLLCDLVVAEHRADPRPLILFGASMGGMLAYEVAAPHHKSSTRWWPPACSTCRTRGHGPPQPASRPWAGRHRHRCAPRTCVFGSRLSIRWPCDEDLQEW